MNKNSKKLSKIALLYIFVALFIAVLSFFSVTLAWYIKTQRQTIGITFANPVVVNVDYKQGTESIVASVTGGNADSVKPGSKVALHVGVSMAQNSSPAYVRAKLTISCDVDNDGTAESFDNFIEVYNGNVVGNFTDVIADLTSWERVEFLNDNGEPDVWYVWKDEPGVAKEVNATENALFYTGEIIISRNMDNRFAGRKIRIEFVVDAMQTEGVVDPIACGEWGKLR